MAGFRAAKRYAKGLMQFATETGKAAEINQEMMDLKNAIQSNRELAQFLNSPVLDSRKKNSVLKEIFKDFSPGTQNFITLVVNHRREGFLRQIATQYNTLYEYSINARTAEVVTATELDDALIQNIVNKAKAEMGDNFTYNIEKKVDPSLIGGFILRVGDKQIDSSVKSKLNRLKKEFDINDYIPKI
jgi:F-type H+-transporting ATPase subunit delta